jgi:hypothetical protein
VERVAAALRYVGVDLTIEDFDHHTGLTRPSGSTGTPGCLTRLCTAASSRLSSATTHTSAWT